jgi:hypothetical protein
VLDAIEGIGRAPGDLIGVALNVRRRVQFLAVLTILGWGAALATVWIGGGGDGLRRFSSPMMLIALAAALVSLGLLAFSILEVRRLPSESEAGHLSRYPRRLR